LKTPPENTVLPEKKAPRTRSVRAAAKEESFQKGIRLLNEAKSIDDPALKLLAQQAAIQICIKDAVVPLGRKTLLTFVATSTVVEAALCIIVILNLPEWAASAIVIVTGGLWVILVAVVLALGNVLSETILAKLMTTVFGKIVEKIAFWNRTKTASDSEE
jgi:hypothetical protein